MTGRVSRAARVRDGLAVILVVAGVALFATGNARLRDMAGGRFDPDGARSAVQQAERVDVASRVGIGVTLLGLGVAAWSFWRHAHPRRSRIS